VKVLGITSGMGITGAGIAGDGKDAILAECSAASSEVQSEKLIGLIDELLKRSKLKISDIEAVAVTTGPGSYSGLRGGLATAKGLVEGLNVPIISVSALRAIAYNLIDTDGAIVVAVNACRDDYNFALFASRSGLLKRLTSDMTLKADNIKKTLSKVTGRITVACDERMRLELKGSGIEFADPKNAVPWGINVARIGIEKLKKRETDDHLIMAPRYSHKPNIREFKK